MNVELPTSIVDIDDGALHYPELLREPIGNSHMELVTDYDTDPATRCHEPIAAVLQWYLKHQSTIDEIDRPAQTCDVIRHLKTRVAA